MSERHSPYEHLEPAPSGARGADAREPGAVAVVLRGIRRRCPRCASRGLFEKAFTIRERCPRCGLHLQREEGGFLGAMIINYTVTVLAWLTVLVAWLVVDLPDVHVLALTLTSVAIAVVVPLAFFRSAKTIWASIDYLVYRSSPDYRSEDAADRAEGNGGPRPATG